MTRAETIRARLKAHDAFKGREAKAGAWSTAVKDVDIKGDDRTILVVANTDDMDLDREVVVPSGADTSYLDRNKQAFADHLYDLDHHVGTVRSFKPYPSAGDHRAWKASIYMLTHKPLAKDILTTAREVGIGVSIGFEAMEAREPDEDEIKRYGDELQSVVVKWKPIEVSFTAMPCNVACQSMASVEDDSKAAAVEDLVVKGLIRRESAAALGLTISPERKVHPVKRVVVVCGP